MNHPVLRIKKSFSGDLKGVAKWECVLKSEASIGTHGGLSDRKTDEARLKFEAYLLTHLTLSAPFGGRV